ncbi:MAG TPA: hypothetical protein VFL81_03510 [Candidatus Saccharimonadales bacterium]|nr:hypothetical protein [Candidatus Saccharimonadales bacterium]
MRRLKIGSARDQGQIVNLFCSSIRQNQGTDPGMIGFHQLEFTKVDPDSGATPDSWR